MVVFFGGMTMYNLLCRSDIIGRGVSNDRWLIFDCVWDWDCSVLPAVVSFMSLRQLRPAICAASMTDLRSASVKKLGTWVRA